MLTYQGSFLECKKNGNYTNFWPPFFEEWEDRWPIILNEEPVNEEAKLEEIAKARDALQTVCWSKSVYSNNALITYKTSA